MKVEPSLLAPETVPEGSPDAMRTRGQRRIGVRSSRMLGQRVTNTRKVQHMKLATFRFPIAAAAAAASVAGSAVAAEILVTADIATSTTWTKNNTYNLQGQIYVLPGATLTIEAGTVIASTTNLGGSLAVVRDARIVALGTADEPIIFTSKADVATWTNGDPKTGTWRATCNEWGNLTICGRGYIGKYGTGAIAGNTAAPNANNVAVMEGLTQANAADTRPLYGGGNDSDYSGVLKYCSFRYGGKVIGLGNELNGISLGGVGRETQIDYVEVMNNVDDGIEIWGGTVDLKHFQIWNIGDDSVDLDHGWRGRGQFGLIVTGYSRIAASGSGFLDSQFEVDGAAKSDAQPVTTCAFFNVTSIGQPLATGRHALKYRDGARVQYNNCVFMDSGAEMVRNDNTDGEATDGQTGYGFNGTLSFAACWTTDSSVTSTVNPFTNPAERYTAQAGGKLCQITDTVFFNNANASAYTTANTVGVFTTANNNVQATASPIVLIERGANVSNGTLIVQPVTRLDPRATRDAATSVGTAPSNSFFVPARYRGGFGPNENWAHGWSAASAYGFLVAPPSDPGSCAADLNGDAFVNGDDLGELLSQWGACN